MGSHKKKGFTSPEGEVIGFMASFVDRGVINQPDFTINDLTADGSWHTLDLSGVVPENAQGVFISIKAISDAVGHKLRVKKYGQAGNLHLCQTRFLVADIEHAFPIIVGCSTDRKIEYALDSGNYSVYDWRIRGWWF